MDIKTDNYLITSEMVLKLTDFGLSQVLENTRSCSSDAGSWRWMSPERLRDQKLSPKFDIYALALVFWCLFTRALPYAEYPTQFRVIDAVCTHKVRPQIPPECPAAIAQLIEACWDDDYKKRPDTKDVLVALVRYKSAFNTSIQHASTQTTQTESTRHTEGKSSWHYYFVATF